MKHALLALFLVSCAGAGRAAEASYSAMLLECVDKAETITESRACRSRVDEAWAVKRDAGL